MIPRRTKINYGEGKSNSTLFSIAVIKERCLIIHHSIIFKGGKNTETPVAHHFAHPSIIIIITLYYYGGRSHGMPVPNTDNHHCEFAICMRQGADSVRALLLVMHGRGAMHMALG